MGSGMFVVGGIVNLLEFPEITSICYLTGNSMYMLGTVLNIVQIYGQQTPALERLANAIGLNYFSGLDFQIINCMFNSGFVQSHFIFTWEYYLFVAF